MWLLRKFYHLVSLWSRIASRTNFSSVVVSCYRVVVYSCIAVLCCSSVLFKLSIMAVYNGIAVCSCYIISLGILLVWLWSAWHWYMYNTCNVVVIQVNHTWIDTVYEIHYMIYKHLVCQLLLLWILVMFSIFYRSWMNLIMLVLCVSFRVYM